MSELAGQLALANGLALWEGYELLLPDQTLRFCAGTNERAGSVVWQGQPYTPWPIQAAEFGTPGQGSPARPKLLVGNFGGTVSALCRQYDDLLGVKLRRRRTLVKYLDAVNFADWRGWGWYSNGAGTVSVANDARLQIAGDLTVCLTLRPDSLVGRQNPLDKAYGGEFAFTQETNGVINFFNGTSGALAAPYTSLGTPAPVNVGQVNRLVLRRQAGQWLRWTMNGAHGAPSGAAAAGAVASAFAVKIGDGYAGRYKGAIFDVRLYARTLSDQEALDYCADAPVDPSALRGWWAFEQDLRDGSGNGLDGVGAGSYSYTPLIDANPSANPAEEYPPETWFITRKAAESPGAVEFELGSPLDLNGVRLPRRQLIAGTCLWAYRSGECGYAGPPVADYANQPTDDPARDQCSRTLTGCKLRFGANGELPFGGFPGLARLPRVG